MNSEPLWMQKYRNYVVKDNIVAFAAVERREACNGMERAFINKAPDFKKPKELK